MSLTLSAPRGSRALSGALLGASFLVAVVWCGPAAAQSSDVGGLMNRLQRLENEVQTLSGQVYRGGGGNANGGGGGALSGSVAADFEVRLTQLETAIRELRGRTEESNFATSQLKDRLDKFAADTDFRFQQLENAATGAPPPSAPQTTAPGKGKEPEAKAEPKADSKPAKGAEVKGDSKPVMGALGGGNDANTQEEYEKSFALLRDANYDKAETALSSFIKKHPGHALTGNAQYWLGETYYVRGKYTEAAVAFAEGYQKYPKNTKAADNLLKLAMSLGQLKQNKDACLALGQLNSQFPDAPATVKRRAESEGKKIGCK
ncbi:MAG TPA: tol-pal system protein YbgF [Azospirillaceae bacterium]|nr:tol-pal system protein YbgF [Azospirillaceae bacterium]